MRTETAIFVITPILITATAAGASYAAFPPGSSTVWPAYLYAFGSVVPGTAPYLAFLIGRAVSAYQTLFTLILNAALLILLFGAIYRGYGLSDAARPDADVSIYFSIVTWTTLGYGDFSPISSLRLLAAGQAVIGYIFLGLIVGLLIELATQARTSSLGGKSPGPKAR